ncbi:hypothetical protein LguiB_027942 [Lonicera macranthoides]
MVIPPHSITTYLKAVNTIQQSVSLPGYQSQSKDAICMAVGRLKLEFLDIMTALTNATKGPSSTNMSSSMSDGTSSSHEIVPFAYNSPTTVVAIYKLNHIAKTMNSAGYVGECFEGLFLDEFKKKIDQLIRAAQGCYWILFISEKKLLLQIFGGIEHDSCFSETIRDAEIQLMNFAEALIASRRSPDKLFKFLALSEGLSNTRVFACPRNYSWAKGPEGAPVLHMNDKIGEVVRAILSDFEKSVAYELSTIPEAGGTIHFLTKYVMDYVNLMVSYKRDLSDFIVSNPCTTFGDLVIPDVEFAQLEGQGQTLALHLVLIIVVLRFKLEEKSKYYKDATLAHLFMANNLHYIVQVIKESAELEEMIGEEYTNKLSENYLRQAISNYQSSTCENMLHCLMDEEEGYRFFSSCFSSRGKYLRRRVKSFNAMIEEICSTQARWVVQHSELREELCLSIVEKVIPAYASFLERFKKRVEGRKYPYIKYSVEDLQTLIVSDLFQKGSPDGMQDGRLQTTLVITICFITCAMAQNFKYTMIRKRDQLSYANPERSKFSEKSSRLYCFCCVGDVEHAAEAYLATLDHHKPTRPKK